MLTHRKIIPSTLWLQQSVETHLASKKFRFLNFIVEPWSSRPQSLACRSWRWNGIRINRINGPRTRTHGMDVPTSLHHSLPLANITYHLPTSLWLEGMLLPQTTVTVLCSDTSKRKVFLMKETRLIAYKGQFTPSTCPHCGSGEHISQRKVISVILRTQSRRELFGKSTESQMCSVNKQNHLEFHVFKMLVTKHSHWTTMTSCLSGSQSSVVHVCK